MIYTNLSMYMIPISLYTLLTIYFILLSLFIYVVLLKPLFNKKYLDISRRIFSRLQLNSLRDLFFIIAQEIKFSKIRYSCKEISIEDFYKILTALGVIQIDNLESDIDITNSNLLVKKYHEHITIGQNQTFDPNKIYNGESLNRYHTNIIVKKLIIYSNSEPGKPGCFSKFKINFRCVSSGNSNIPYTAISFENCILQGPYSNINPNGSVFWHFTKHEKSLISFLNCFFIGVSTHITEKTSSACAAWIGICFKNVVSISSSGGYCLYTDFYSDSHTQRNELDLSFRKLIVDNCFFTLAHTTGLNFIFKGKNIIKNFSISNPEYKIVADGTRIEKVSIKDLREKFPLQIYWGPYQRLEPYNSNQGWENYKKLILLYKNQAEKRKDNFQVNILKREILICDRNLIKKEPILHALQDRITLAFNAYITNYGISWFRPLLILFILNMLFSIMVNNILYPTTSLLKIMYVFLEAFNLITSVVNYTTLNDINNKYVIAVAIDLIQKIFFAILIYEIIRVARRFTKYS